MRAPERQRGFLLPLAIVLMVAAAGLMVVISYMVTSSTHSSVSHISATQALFIAESALARGTRALLSEDFSGGSDSRIACGAVSGDANLTNINLANGVYTVTADNAGISYYNGGTTAAPAVTTLSANINSTATVIPISAVSTYPSAGRVMIDREVIDYSGIEASDNVICGGTAPCLLGVRRARDDSSAAAHSNGTAIGQYQCALRAQAGVPDLANPLGRRTLTEAVQLQEAWAVGDGTGVTTGTGFTNNLRDIVCLNADNNCWAIGQNGFYAQWNGTDWSNTGTVAGIGGETLNSISCRSPTECWAVGQDTNTRYTIAQLDPVNGIWTDRDYNPSEQERDLNGVACISGGVCIAVGDNGRILEHTNPSLGTPWTNTASGTGANLRSVTCSPDDNCWAVGDDAGGNFVILRRNAATGNWTANPSIAPGQSRNLYGVACDIANECVGAGERRGNDFMTVRSADPHAGDANWTATEVAGTPNEHLYGVACRADIADECWAVGDVNGANFTLALYNGTTHVWSSQPLNGGGNAEVLRGISCATGSTYKCWAVGDNGSALVYDGTNWVIYTAGGGNASLARFNETAWIRQNAMVPVGADDLNAVSMLNYADGWAVGDRIGGNATIARWTGSAWISVPPNPVINQNLNGIYCVDASNCWAVGNNNGANITIRYWNGASWTDQSFNPPGNSVDLNDIYCVSTTDCWAVGDDIGGDNFVWARWNGATWTKVTLFDNNDAQNLRGIYCVDANNCWAVGDNDGGNMTVLYWNGTSWAQQSFNPPGNSADLNDIHCVSTTDCWAVGDDDNGGGNNDFVFARWNGTTWSKVTLADAARENLNGIVCANSNDCWAVGNERNGNYTRLHWDGTTWSVQLAAGAANNEDLNAIDMVAPNGQPRSAWREAFP